VTEQDKKGGDLTVTALYTAQTWKWGGFEGAELFATRRGRDVFNATNLALGAARLFRWGLPSLRHSLVQRHAMIDHIVVDSECKQIVELAAGLSRRGATFSQDPGVRYVEVDLPKVVEHKRELLARSEQGRAVADRESLHMIAGDAEKIDLAELVVGDGPVLVVAEGLLMYLDGPRQRRLWSRVAELISARPGSRFAFDLVPFCEQPKPGVMGRALAGMFKRATRGSSFAFDERTRDDLVRELGECGFADVELVEPHTAPSEWQVPHLGRRTQTLVFVCG